MGTLEYGDSVRQMERLKDAAMRQRPPFVQSEERAAWRDSSRRNLDQRRFILDYYRDVIHSASESRRNVAERSFHNLVEICCAHCVLIPNAASSGIVAKNHAAELTAAIPDNQLASGRCPETLLHKPNYRVADHTIGMSHGNGAALFPLSL
jgi:hypothetical protein